MTREEKIQNILTATQKAIDEMVAKGEMTPERYSAIVTCQNSALLAVTNE